MSRLFLGNAFAFALICTFNASFGLADSAQDDGLKQGDSIGVFYVTKVAGADDDGVEPGEDLCYRCRYGSRPMVMVFARETGGKVNELLKAIDSAIIANEEEGLRGLLTLMGEDAAQLKEQAGEIAKEGVIKRVPLSVAKDTQNGPINYKLSRDAPVTIVLAKDSQVVTTHTFKAGAIDVGAVMKEVKEMLN
ncbi:MAG: hypothetical protein AB8B91_09610 [Rubripirellula sp.]